MADTTLSPTNLVQPEVGASEDSWGTKLNAGLALINGWFQGSAGAPILKIANGGTGGATAGDARTGLGLGAAALLGESSGTWTPALAFSTVGTSSWVYTDQLGSYRRIGKLWFIQFTVTATPTIGTGTGALRIEGVPSSIDITTGITAGALRNITSSFSWGAGITNVTVSAGGSNFLVLRGMGSAASAVTLGASNMTSAASHSLSGSIMYMET